MSYPKICLSLLVAFFSISLAAHAATEWQAPTPEELSMKSEPKAPGAIAIYLDRERTDNNLNYQNSTVIHERIKILTEAGKDKYGSVAILYESRWQGVDNFEGRTIHSDGTVIPFQGKGLDHEEVRDDGEHVHKKVFPMPDVQVGSIIEYRYTVSYGANYIEPPTWYVQTDLFTRRIHDEFTPFIASTTRYAEDRYGHELNELAFTGSLPPGVQPKMIREATVGNAGDTVAGVWHLDMQDVPPLPHVAHLPPIHNLSYRVTFFYTASRSGDEFWKIEGEYWSKSVNKFATPGSQVKGAVAKLKQGSEEQTLRAIYAAVMQLQNTDYIHSGSISAEEQKSPAKSSDDIWERKRGNAKQITRLFVAMARAAGMQADVMDVTNRNRNIFSKAYLSLDQLNGEVAIVNVNGKEQFFDPGSLYCPYGQLAWVHTLAGGLRQTNSGTALAVTPSMGYKDSSVQRTAELWLTNTGSVAGTVQLAYGGQDGMRLRQWEADKDFAGATKDFENMLKDMLPAGMSVRLIEEANAKNIEQPLILNYRVSGPVATAMANHLLVPSQFFRAQAKQVFVAPSRKYAVYFHYPYTMVDQVELKLPASVQAESLPKEVSASDPQVAVYQAKAVQQGSSIIFQRMFALASIYIEAKDYPQLQSFYSQVNASDTTPAVFTRPAVAQ